MGPVAGCRSPRVGRVRSRPPLPLAIQQRQHRPSNGRASAPACEISGQGLAVLRVTVAIRCVPRMIGSSGEGGRDRRPVSLGAIQQRQHRPSNGCGKAAAKPRQFEPDRPPSPPRRHPHWNFAAPSAKNIEFPVFSRGVPVLSSPLVLKTPFVSSLVVITYERRSAFVPVTGTNTGTNPGGWDGERKRNLRATSARCWHGGIVVASIRPAPMPWRISARSSRTRRASGAWPHRSGVASKMVPTPHGTRRPSPMC